MSSQLSPAILSSSDLDRIISAVERLPKSLDDEFNLSQIIYNEHIEWEHLFEAHQFAAGQVVFYEGDPGESAYVIREGSLAIVKGDFASPVILGRRGKGETIGEMALLEEELRSAAAVALENSLLMEIKRENFFVLLKESHRFTESILRLLSMRVREASDAVESATLEKIQDPLTELYNRRYMQIMLRHEMQHAQRAGYPVSLIMMDIDHFKQVNDTYGHPAGDQVLRCLATLMKSQIRQADIACRYGGEEFLIILPETSLEIAAKRAESLRQGFAELSIEHDGQRIQCKLSLGVAAFPLHAQAPKHLIQCADTALYAAKTGGRNQVVVATAS